MVCMGNLKEDSQLSEEREIVNKLGAEYFKVSRDKFIKKPKEYKEWKVKMSERDIHTYFGLSYANYLVIPRSVLQSMPEEWQLKFVKLLEELDSTNWRDLLPKESMYKVELRDYGYEFNEETGSDEFTWKNELHDPLINYDRGRRNVFK